MQSLGLKISINFTRVKISSRILYLLSLDFLYDFSGLKALKVISFLESFWGENNSPKFFMLTPYSNNHQECAEKHVCIFALFLLSSKRGLFSMQHKVNGFVSKTLSPTLGSEKKKKRINCMKDLYMGRLTRLWNCLSKELKIAQTLA